MVTNKEATESRQILLFVVLPLFVLFLSALILAIRRKRPLHAQFPDFSVTLKRLAQQDSYIVYEAPGKRLEFCSGAATGDTIHLRSPSNFPSNEIQPLVANLAQGLAALGFPHYSVEAENQVIART